MKPQKLVICGWGPYKNRTEVDFTKFEGRGIFLITGATGAGKTTLFDAISYALYGSLSGETRDKERNSVRSDFAESETPTYVELEMTHAGKSYRIRRNPEYLRPKKRSGGERAYTKEKENAVLYLPEEKVIEGVREVNAYIRELLSLDFSQFKQLSMIAQGEFARLLTASPKDKTKIFREIFGTGVYERFTAILGAKARIHYQQVMEQKHRLEEDVRMLVFSVQKWEDSKAGAHFLQLTSSENWNYEQINSSLGELKKEAEVWHRQYDKSFKDAEKQLESSNTLYVQKKEENKRVLEYRAALAVSEELQKQKEEYLQKEVRYKQAVNAGWAEIYDLKVKQTEKQLRSVLSQEETLAEEIRETKASIDALLPFSRHLEKIRQLIETMTEYEKKAQNILQLENTIREKEIQLAEGTKQYLQKEALSTRAREAYENALRAQRHAAIGLAASLLEEGKPCPVCGSTEHPNPAEVSKEALSEEEIERLKEQCEQLEEDTGIRHSKVVALQTQLQENQNLLKTETEKKGLLEQQIEAAAEPVCREFAQMGAKKAGQEWQERYSRMQQLQTILLEKEKRSKQLADARKTHQEEKETADREFRDALSQYAFADEAAYRQAYLSKTDREKLEKEIEQYQNKAAANKKLTEHLQQSIGADKLHDLPDLEEEMTQKKREREQALHRLKETEQLLTEVKRTMGVFAQKKGMIEKQSAQYGYIKELENMASGNNKKKLVFEQYVLAGYFEEILQAANIRFRKMTSGRYEMRRTKEVGDGRTKDNLEIEVLDYYTGKYRSVRTLSGGESFKASLCLALGLSDVIQAGSGGIRVETLFIDEGFGALDSESLDQACATLKSLAESERLIGIISHVPELRERIDKQIVIEKSGSGSTLKVVI